VLDGGFTHGVLSMESYVFGPTIRPAGTVPEALARRLAAQGER
jgi:hypothetical protein